MRTLNGMPIQMLNGITDLHMQPDGMYGCSCENGLGAVSDYATITVGGQQYSANQILDKTVYAKQKTAVYMNGDWKTPEYYVQPGQMIGVVYSYLSPSAARDGRSALLFYNGLNQAYYVINENTIDTGTLKEQGALTVKQEIQAEKDKELRENSPVEYYLKKYGVPAILIISGIVIAGNLARDGFKHILKKSEATPEPALGKVTVRKPRKRKPKK
jgi:hypothetical protein